MPRSYRHIKEYEKEILESKEQNLTKREMGNKLVFSSKQIHNFITRHNANQRKTAAGEHRCLCLVALARTDSKNLYFKRFCAYQTTKKRNSDKI